MNIDIVNILLAKPSSKTAYINKAPYEKKDQLEIKGK